MLQSNVCGVIPGPKLMFVTQTGKSMTLGKWSLVICNVLKVFINSFKKTTTHRLHVPNPTALMRGSTSSTKINKSRKASPMGESLHAHVHSFQCYFIICRKGDSLTKATL